MKFSYQWLQKYFSEKLPEPKKVADLLTMHSFEVEGIENKGNDFIFDIKILANRAHDCLSYFGIAREISVLLNLEIIKPKINNIESNFFIDNFLDFSLEDKTIRRGMKRLIFGIQVNESPQWLKNYLEVIGQKSINNIVDLTNFIMWETGQPVHIFDWDKISGSQQKKVTIRRAEEGEKITTLDNKNFVLNSEMLVIADKEKALDIAGIKGGIDSGVDNNTKNILLSSCNFDPIRIRKTSQKLNLKTDASYRFEHDIHPEVTSWAMEYLSSLILENTGGEKVSEIKDIYPEPFLKKVIEVDLVIIEKILGLKIEIVFFEDILNKLGFTLTKDDFVYKLKAPFGRLDIEIKEDIAEEVGRFYGYENIIINIPEKIKVNIESEATKEFYYFSKIREFLVQKGFSEINTSNFVKEGEWKLINPLTEDKKFLRNNIHQGIQNSLDFNSYYADLLVLEKLKIFESGKVFTQEGEYNTLSLGIKNLKKNKNYLGEENEIKILIKELEEFLGINIGGVLFLNQNIIEVKLDDLIKILPKVNYDNYFGYFPEGEINYKMISPYPFVVRDISLFVPQGIDVSLVEKTLIDNSGDLLVKIKLFDVFEKEFPDGLKKNSYAFHLIFQSLKKTLTDEEINQIIQKNLDVIKLLGWEVR